ncbi:MAG: THUMP domain-containing protein [Hadesarchaea archaeon]|nr:THUMP domain-containing protein [Hadesarchaea archaeon]
MRTIIVRYGELVLKSEPVRRRFERRLVSNINLTLSGLKYSIRKTRGRIFIDTSSAASVMERLSKVPGIVSVSPSVKVSAHIDKIRSAAINAAKRALAPGMSFAIRTSRVGKHPFSSRDVNVNVGSAILSEIKGVRVNLSSPDREIFMEIRENDAYIFTETVKGPGGLPVGTQGRAVALFSGNHNDVVAAYLMMKRGCAMFPVFFDPRHHADGRALKLATASAKKLADFYPKLELRSIPFGKVLDALSKVATGGAAYCIYRRSALQAAEAIARHVGGEAIVTGDDARLLAALKLTNLNLIDEACGIPVLRPLAGVSGAEIRQLEICVKPPQRTRGACPFLPPHNVVKPKEIQRLEDSMKIRSLVEESIRKLRVIKLR